MQVICLEEPALYELVELVVARLKPDNEVQREKWVGQDHAMRLLNIKAKSTLQKLRDEGKIRFSQPQKKVILYDIDSIREYLEKHARNMF